MGLEQVIGEVRQDGDARAQRLLDDARARATELVAEAEARARAYEEQRLAQAERDGEQVRAQVLSSAEFEARKTALTAEAELRTQLRETLVEGFAALPQKTRDAHVKRLLATAETVLGGSGRVWATAQDQKAASAGPYAFAGTLDGAGGIVVESDDGTQRLDLRYETLLADLWRDILREEATLFA